MSKYARPHKWTDEQKKFVTDNIKGTPIKEMHQMVNDKFDLNLTINQIAAYLKRNRLGNGIKTQFVKGQTSWNKGKKGWSPPGSEKGWFKKGHYPHNKREIGDVVIDSEGYTRIKVAEKGTYTERFESKHRLIWEEHNGTIPDGHSVIFGDGNRKNFDPDNLILVSKAQLGVMNSKGLYRYDTELTRTGAILAEVVIKTHEKMREGRESGTSRHHES